MKLKIPVILFLAIFLTNCNNKSELKNYPDPYLEAFWGKGIKSMIAYDPHDSIREDSLRRERLTFDNVGNIVHRTAFMTNDTMSYDSRHFMTRKVQKLEAPTNFVINYHFDNDRNLIQVWNALRHREWEYNDDDLTRADKDTVKFEIDGEGRIMKQHDSEKTIVHHYADDKLMRKEVYLKSNNGPPINAILYTYSDRKIKKIEQFRGKDLRETHYYSDDGLLDSTEHVFKGQTSVTKYRYAYFDVRE